MAEGFEKTAFQEAMNESVVGKAVRVGIRDVQQTKSDYWEIRQNIEDRKNASGRGVYSHYVENMDKIIHFMYAGQELGVIGKIAEASKKVAVRVKAAVPSFLAATGDVAINFVTWLPRKLSPLFPVPKDPLKRMLLGKYDLKLAYEAARAGLVRGKLGITERVRSKADAMFQTPEIAARMYKRRAERMVNWLKSPFTEQKPAMPKARP